MTFDELQRKSAEHRAEMNRMYVALKNAPSHEDCCERMHQFTAMMNGGKPKDFFSKLDE